MAVGGQRPKAAVLRLVDGTKAAPTLPKDSPIAEGRPVPPAWLKGRALELWHHYLPMLFWLAGPDAPKFSEWCEDRAEYEKCGRKDWPTARRAEHRKLGSELGFDPTARARMSGSGGAGGKADEGESFFGSSRA